jgi:16S rRNA (guanine(966)-N(2))-methyltransferase RsmD
VKESVFGILGERCLGARVLDLFAGTGSLGIEALSRGAAGATFVERDPGAVRVLRENLRHTGFAGTARVFVKEAVGAVRGVATREGGGPYDLVFLDPPYATDLAREALERLGEAGAPLAGGAVVVAEHSNHALPAEEIGLLRLTRRERYGETVVSFYLRREPAGEPPEGGEAAR